MSNFSKLTAIFFAIMLSYVSISKDNYEKSLPVSFQGTGTERSSASFSEVSEAPLQDIFCLQRHIEHVVNPVNSFPAPTSNLKDHPGVFSGISFSIESRIQSIASQYLSHSKEIDRSLTISDIIFPFDYFW